MLRACAEQQLQAMEAGSSTASATAVRQAYVQLAWWRQLGQRKKQLAASMQLDAQQRRSRERVQALASPLLLTVWFNSWCARCDGFRSLQASYC